MENKDFKNRLSALILAGAMTAMPVAASTNTNEVSSTNEYNVEEYINIYTTEYYNYVMDENNQNGIFLGKDTIEESFNKKRTYLMNLMLEAYAKKYYPEFWVQEDDYYNVSEEQIPVSKLQKFFDEMYGENAFVTLKEYEYRVKGYSKEKLTIEKYNTILFSEIIQRQIGLFPNSTANDERQNLISSLEINSKALNNINKTGIFSEYQTVYNLNEFVTACLGNAILNEKIEESDKVWGVYTNSVMNPVFCNFNTNDRTIKINMTESVKMYPTYQEVKSIIPTDCSNSNVKKYYK